jgi:hypothetical protein
LARLSAPSRIRLGVLERQMVRLTGGSRELPIAWQFYGRIRTIRNALGENVTLGHSREPPVAEIIWQVRDLG